MRFMILGAGPGLPHPDYHLSSILVQTEQHNLLVDCGDGTSMQVLKHEFDKDFLDAVLISHYHPDHISGIFMLIQMLYLQSRTKPLQLFLPERKDDFIDIMHMFYTFEDRFHFELKVHLLSKVKDFYPYISFAQSDHLVGYEHVIKQLHCKNTMQSYSLMFSEQNRNLVYTSDLRTFANITPLLDNANTIIIDALHPRAELIMSLQDNVAEKIILTHGISKELSNIMKSNSSQKFEFACEDEYYPV